jgi:uncharacterized protein
MPKSQNITFDRVQATKLKGLAKSFPVVSLIGPRQSGKTTIARSVFSDYAYISLEELDNRTYACEDPRGFLADYHNKTIIDEVQRAPELFSYMQSKVDEFDTPGQYILTGSAHLALLEKLTQSLAGRAALLKLLPLNMLELKKHHLQKSNSEEQLFTGFYPRLYKHQIEPSDWYPNYIQTYLEKDVREIINVKNLLTFKRFLGLCAGRHGQILDVSSLANDCGIARQTVAEWLSVLEASFLIYFLPPFYKNFNKRLIKSPKLYFYDSGLVCSLLKIESSEQLKKHYLKGAIFEGYVITEVIKQRYNSGKEPHVYYWREKHGNEIDCIIEHANKNLAIEIKSSRTIDDDFFKGLVYWQKLSGNTPSDCYLVHGGDQGQQRKRAKVLPWDKLGDISDEIHS